MVGAIFRQDAEFKIKGGGLICLGLADVRICCSDVLAGGGLVVGAECWADLFDSVSEEEQFDDIVIDESVDGVGEGGNPSVDLLGRWTVGMVRHVDVPSWNFRV